MWTVFSVVLTIFLCSKLETVLGGSFNPAALSKYNDFAKTPLNPETIQTGGRLIERHLQYLAQAGFKSILSVVEFTTNDTVYNGVSGSFPASAYEMSLAASYGLSGKYVASQLTPDYANSISAIIDDMPKPLYIHCHVGWTANLFTQLHLYLKKEVTADAIYPNSLNMGYDYQNNTDAVNLINAVTGLASTTHPEAIEQTLASGEYSYKYYYWTHRLGNSDYWFNAGQILSTHIDAIKTAGYKVILSFRPNGEATVRLPTDPATGPIPNDEFSDEQGNYDIAMEEKATKTAGMKFISLPLVSGSEETWSKETFRKYYPIMQYADSKGPVLAHCASGYRSAAFTLTFVAFQDKKCSDWALQKAKEIGFDYNNSAPTSNDVQVMNFMKEILGC